MVVKRGEGKTLTRCHRVSLPLLLLVALRRGARIFGFRMPVDYDFVVRIWSLLDGKLLN